MCSRRRQLQSTFTTARNPPTTSSRKPTHCELMEKYGFWYGLSKNIAERSAWEFVEGLKEPNFDLVTTCPTWILGPMLQPELNESSKTIYDYVCGNIQEIPRGDKAIVDVRDGAHRCVREPASVWSLLSCGRFCY
ncbi:hypothetical protein AeMF1_010638 [Aphanomyces euteiches]|nr:hypothetical protein AeMF1_010638 [Aphanomyces euteiches]KAH9196400.1 hypothetical protein AeNC1_001620 [Aphanomyces euteiches]